MSDINMISLFTGAGGLDYGFEAEGFNNRCAVEIDQNCVATIRANRSWPIIDNDIHKITCREILNVAGISLRDVDLLIGGPPCQPFSKSGYWITGDTKRLGDERANTLQAFIRCVEELQPEAFVLENVQGIIYSGKDEGFKLLEKEITRINSKQGTSYKLSWEIINAADYGVPQIRKRFFLIGHRDGMTFSFPRATHAPQCEKDDDFNSDSHYPPAYSTAWDAIGDLENAYQDECLMIKSKWGDLLPSIPEGHNYLWHTNRSGGYPLFGWRTRYWSFLLKLAKSLPSWTIQANSSSATGPFHWKNRRLSIKELARLQTFPDDIEFCGSRKSIQRQIGNAVPSLLAEVIARAIAEQFFDARLMGPLNLSVESQRPVPPPEEIQPLSEKYFNLIGNHLDHPGSGKGPLRRPAIGNEYLTFEMTSHNDKIKVDERQCWQ